jgi:hypothetical protein
VNLIHRGGASGVQEAVLWVTGMQSLEWNWQKEEQQELHAEVRLDTAAHRQVWQVMVCVCVLNVDVWLVSADWCHREVT